MVMIDFGKVKQLVDEGYIRAQRHPTAPLTIYNYSEKAQFEWHWTPETRACRGLIVDDQNWIVARPFEKFFTVEQLTDTPLPLEPFEVYEKLDGSLGILYHVDGQPFIATRGSFISEQAKRATQMLRTKYKHVKFNPDLTYLFEIIYPENRVVVDYGDTEDLFLLAVIDTATGREFDITYEWLELGMPMVERFDGLTEFAALKNLEANNKEGFVVRFESGMRVKVKFDEYKRLHRLITGINPRHIWEELREGRPLDDLIERVPDEYFQWVKKTEAGLRDQYDAIENQCRADFKVLESRKDTALYFQTKEYPSVLFSMLDGKNYAPHIWRMIRPEAAAAFRCDIDA